MQYVLGPLVGRDVRCAFSSWSFKKGSSGRCRGCDLVVFLFVFLHPTCITLGGTKRSCAHGAVGIVHGADTVWMAVAELLRRVHGAVAGL
jgi:hypothetical protein